MESIKYLVITTVAIAITIVSSWMTIQGYVNLYSGHHLIISALFIVLEATKATIFGIIFVYANRRHKVILLTLAIFLVCLSFVGHFSFLSSVYSTNKVHAQVSQEYVKQTQVSNTTQLQDIDTQIKMLQDQIKAGNDEIKTLTDTATGLTSANSRNWAVSTNKRRVKEIQDANIKLQNDIKELYAQKRELLNISVDNAKASGTQIAQATHHSIFEYTADMLGIHQDQLARVINFILALVIDSLALAMLWTAGEMWKQYRQESKRYTPWGRSPFPTYEASDLVKIQYSDFDPTPQESQPSTPSQPNFKDTPSTLPTTIDNDPEQFLFNGKTIDDVVGMSDSEVAELQAKVKTKAQHDWLSFALRKRKLKGDLIYKELK